MHFHTSVFGERLIGLPKFGHLLPGVIVMDNRFVTSRERSLSVYTVVEVDERDQKLPPHPEPVDAVIKACGEERRSAQVKGGCGAGRTTARFTPGAGDAAAESRGRGRSTQTRARKRVQAAGLSWLRWIGRVSLDSANAGQYSIGDADQWQKIVENLAAMVRELDRSSSRDRTSGRSFARMV